MRRFGIILLGVGMAVAMSCSKDDTHDDLAGIPQQPANDSNVISNLTTTDGTFEGEWRLSKYGMTCDGQIEVKGDRITFDIPADYLFPRLEFVTEKKKAMYPDEPLFSTEHLSYFNTKQTMSCAAQGFSDDANYYEVNNIISETDYGIKPSFGVKADGVDYRIDLIGIKEQPTAVFDFNTKLWTVAIPIDQVSAYNCQTATLITSSFLDEEAPERSAWLFIFRAKKRIG